MNPAPDEPTPPRSSMQDDFASAQPAAGPREAIEVEPEHPSPVGSPSSGLLGVGLIAGLAIFLVGLLISHVLGAIASALGLGLAVVALARLQRRAGTLGRLALAALGGFIALVVGLVLGIRSYDERFFGDRANEQLWDAVSVVGFLLTLLGLLATVVSLVALLIAAVVRSIRRG